MASAYLAYLVAAPFTVFLSIRFCRLIRNYSAARKLNLPIVTLPVSFDDPWWLLLRPLFSWVERLPYGLGSWYLYTDMGWPMVDGNKTVTRLGENFILVSPTRNQIITANPAVAERIYKDIKTWILPAPHSQVFTFYGQNVSSTNVADWQRHRKITAPAFNDKSMRYVWDESIRRATEVLNFTRETSRTLADIRRDFEILAMHVLATVAFGQDTNLTSIPPGHRLTLMDSLGFVLKHIFISIVFAGLKVPNMFLPSVLRRLKLSVSELKLYMEESVLRQMHLSSSKPSKDTRTTSLLEAMVNANEAEKHQIQAPTSKPTFLTESELYGNLFVFNLAGYETTAGTMTFALPYLAAHSEIQDWLTEEVDAHCCASGHISYEATYPKLVRCLALMYETLRLASPAPQMIRSPTVPTSLPISSSANTSSITVQPDTLISAHFYSLHLSARWGPDARVFNPRRFVSMSPEGGRESLAVPPDGAMYIAWLFGPRVCPGKKFSQVEFVAVIAHILSLYRIEVLKEGEECDEAARRRLMEVLDEKFFNVSAHLKRPSDAGVKFVRRRTGKEESNQI